MIIGMAQSCIVRELEWKLARAHKGESIPIPSSIVPEEKHFADYRFLIQSIFFLLVIIEIQN